MVAAKTAISHNLPRDVFLHFLAIITLVVSAVTFGILIFEYINIYFPDILLDPYFHRPAYYGSMRSALATLVIVFPVFLWVSWFLRQDLHRFPEKREFKIRKWLLYLTLFVSALVIIGDLVVLMRNFLEGELSQRFVFKVLTILFIAGSVFLHYLSELKDKEKEFPWIKFFDSAVVIFIIFGVGSGFYLAGSPQSQRLVRFDDRRTEDLQWIQGELINYWQRKGKLPYNLDELKNTISGFIPPQDPETGKSYEYAITGDLKFQLCAEFATSTLNGQSQSKGKPISRPAIDYPAEPTSKSNSNWQHDAGRYCFDRTIDPDFYNPVNKNSEEILKRHPQ